jgi:hypothetical protein
VESDHTATIQHSSILTNPGALEPWPNEHFIDCKHPERA